MLLVSTQSFGVYTTQVLMSQYLRNMVKFAWLTQFACALFVRAYGKELIRFIQKMEAVLLARLHAKTIKNLSPHYHKESNVWPHVYYDTLWIIMIC